MKHAFDLRARITLIWLFKYYELVAILLRRISTIRASIVFCQFFFGGSTEIKDEVNTMELVRKHACARVRMKTADPDESRFYSELRNWVNGAIFEAEKNKDFDKKNRFMSLLKEL